MSIQIDLAARRHRMYSSESDLSSRYLTRTAWLGITSWHLQSWVDAPSGDYTYRFVEDVQNLCFAILACSYSLLLSAKFLVCVVSNYLVCPTGSES